MGNRRTVRPLTLGTALILATLAAGAPRNPSNASDAQPRPLAAALEAVRDRPEDRIAEALWEYTGSGDPSAGAIDQVLTRSVLGYRSPSRVVAFDHGAVPASSCVAERSAEQWDTTTALYCRTDETIIYHAGLMGRLLREIGPFGPVAMLAHEWGHHVQALTGRGRASLQNELWADCLSGFIVYSIEAPDLLASELVGYRLPDYYEPIRLQFYGLGNTGYRELFWGRDNEHGSPVQRVHAWQAGWGMTGTELCAGYARWQPRDAVRIGSYRVLPLAGRPGANGTDPWLDDPDLGRFHVAYVPLPAVGQRPVERLAELMLAWLLETYGGGALAAFRVLGPLEALGSDRPSYYYALNLDGAGQGGAAHGLVGLVESSADPGHGLMVTSKALGEAPFLIEPDGSVSEVGTPADTRRTLLHASAFLTILAQICAPHQGATVDTPDKNWNLHCHPQL